MGPEQQGYVVLTGPPVGSEKRRQRNQNKKCPWPCLFPKDHLWVQKRGGKGTRTRSVHHLVFFLRFAVAQLKSHVHLFKTLWTAAHQVPLFSVISWNSLKFISTESVMLSNNFILCRPFSFCLQSFPASGAFPTSRLFASGGQSTEASALASVLPVNIQDWFALGLTGLMSLLWIM